MEYESTLWYIVRKSLTPFIPNEQWFMSSPTFPTPEPDDPGPEPSPEPSPELGASGPAGPDDPASQPVPAGGNDGEPESPESPQSPESAESAEPAWSGDEEEAADYLGELMAAVAGGEELTAEDICGAGFGQDGTAEQMHPGPVLAALVHAATTDDKILATLPDDDLIGVIAAVRRIGSFAAWAEMTAVREFATRPDPRRPATPGAAPGSAPGSAPGAASGAAPGAGAASGAASGGAAGGRGAARGIDGRDPNAAVAGLPGRPKVREFAAEELALDLHLTWQSAAGQIAYACTV